MSFLAGCDERAIEGKIFAIDNLIMFESVCLCTTSNPNQIAAIESKMLTLQEDRRELSLKLSNASDITLQLAGVTPGTDFPQIPIQRKAIDQPPITVNQPPPPTTPNPPSFTPSINMSPITSSQPSPLPLPLPLPIQHNPFPQVSTARPIPKTPIRIIHSATPSSMPLPTSNHPSYLSS